MKRYLRLFVILTAGCLMTSCKSFSVLNQTPANGIYPKLPPMNVVIDAPSFASITGASNTETISSGTGMAVGVNPYMAVGVGVGSSSSTTYTSPALRDIETLYRNNMYNNIVERDGNMRGTIVCRLIDGDHSVGLGMAVLSGFTLCTLNLFGMPFGSYRSKMVVQLEVYDEAGNRIATYTSGEYKAKKWCALYWGYTESKANRAAHCAAFKKCLEDINDKMRFDAKNLSERLDRASASQTVPVVAPVAQPAYESKPSPQPESHDGNVEVQLAQLKRWLDAGIITQEEFNAKRRELIGF